MVEVEQEPDLHIFENPLITFKDIIRHPVDYAIATTVALSLVGSCLIESLLDRPGRTFKTFGSKKKLGLNFGGKRNNRM